MVRHGLIAVMLTVGMLCPVAAQQPPAEQVEIVLVRVDHLQILLRELERLRVIADSKGCI